MNTPMKTTLAAVMTSTIMHITPAYADDVANVKAASAAFYTALKTLDDGTAVSNTFAEQPYITFVGPMSKDIVVGSTALKAYFAKVNPMFAKRDVQIDAAVLQMNGSVAWELGHEHGENEMKDGKKIPINWVVTNIFEKQSDGQWLMVSHHVQPSGK